MQHVKKHKCIHAHIAGAATVALALALLALAFSPVPLAEHSLRPASVFKTQQCGKRVQPCSGCICSDCTEAR